MNDATNISPGLPRRLAALLYDSCLVAPLIMAAVAIAMGVHTATAVSEDVAPLAPWLVQVLALLCLYAFFAAFWLKGGQTLGMQAWRVKLVALPGYQLTPGRIALRLAGALLSAGCLGLGYLWCLVDRRGRYWHDVFSHTALVLVPKKRS